MRTYAELAFAPNTDRGPNHRQTECPALAFSKSPASPLRAARDRLTRAHGGLAASGRPAWLNGSGSDEGDSGPESGFGSRTITRPQQRTRTPPMYKVLLLNDDFTPMEFVVHVLQKFFQKEYNEASRIMLEVHHRGAGVAGIFSYEIAETKVFQVNQYSKQNQYPLKCTMEKT